MSKPGFMKQACVPQVDKGVGYGPERARKGGAKMAAGGGGKILAEKVRYRGKKEHPVE